MTKNLFLTFVVFLSFLLSACEGSPANPGPAAGETATPVAQPTVQPGQPTVQIVEPAPTATQPVVATQVGNPPALADCAFAAPTGDPNNWPKTKIELVTLNTWFHRVFNERLFNAANNWGGADSWFVSLALGANSGGSWTSMSNPGQIVYRATSTSIQWCLGVLTTGQHKTQFMGESTMPAAINVRIAPESIVTVITASGKIVRQATSDMGDITVILPDSGVVTISVSYTTAAPTHESLVWWGPYDRSTSINTVDAR